MDSSDQTAEIRTELDNVAFVPEETVRGTVTWRATQTPREVILRLFYYTEGKGTQDIDVIEERRFEAPASHGTEDFEFVLPSGPYTFSGKLISLIWALELVVGDDGPVERREIVLSPTSQEIDLYRHAHDDMPDYASFHFGGSKGRKRGRRSR